MNKQQPLVTVICLCYNHARYVKQAVDSVLKQTYGNIELIIIDDASADESPKVIKENYASNPEIQLILLKENIGNCKAFNLAYKKSKGQFIIDLAADDILLPTRVECGVREFSNRDDTYGVNFSNAEIINPSGEFIKLFYKTDSKGHVRETVPEGDVFENVIRTYFICPPTMMYARTALDELGGYDELLTYEDFDFWVRSSRMFKYCFTDQVLVKKRILPNSKSRRQFGFRSRDTRSTLEVLKKAKNLVRSDNEKNQLKARLRYEVRKTLFRGQPVEAYKLAKLYAQV